jgi:hypothetical protein
VQKRKLIDDILNKEQIWVIKEYEANKYAKGNNGNNFIWEMQHFELWVRYKLKQLY